MESDRERLERALDEDPGDQVLRAVLCDLREEVGEDTRAMRWCVARKKYPIMVSFYSGVRWWGWYGEGGTLVPGVCHALLPQRLVDLMPEYGWPFYPARCQAEQALERAFTRAVAAGWDPVLDCQRSQRDARHAAGRDPESLTQEQ